MSRLKTDSHPLFTAEIIKALFSKQIYSYLDFIHCDSQQLVKTTRLNFKEVLTIKNSFLKNHSAIPESGYDYYQNILKNTVIFPTGITGVDNLLNGGLFTGNIYEICGLPASGKTHFIIGLIKHVLETTNQKVYLFDTKCDFSATRLNKMLIQHNQERRLKLLKHLFVNQVNSRNELLNALYSLKSDLQNGLDLRLVIIDSLPALILNSLDHTVNKCFLNHFVNIMRYIVTELHVIFLITNLITVWYEQNERQEKITCGKYWFLVPNTRLRIEKLSDTYRLTNLSSHNVETSVDLKLTSQVLS